MLYIYIKNYRKKINCLYRKFFLFSRRGKKFPPYFAGRTSELSTNDQNISNYFQKLVHVSITTASGLWRRQRGQKGEGGEKMGQYGVEEEEG